VNDAQGQVFGIDRLLVAQLFSNRIEQHAPEQPAGTSGPVGERRRSRLKGRSRPALRVVGCRCNRCAQPAGHPESVVAVAGDCIDAAELVLVGRDGVEHRFQRHGYPCCG